MPVEIVRRPRTKKYSTRKLRKIADAVLALVNEQKAELSLALIGDDEMRKLNAEYRHKDYPTDVLSFPIESNVTLPARLLGDVVISVDKAASQAKEHGRTLDQEMATLLVHGIVHLLGYDHERSQKDARVMKRLENKIYRRLCEQGLIKV